MLSFFHMKVLVSSALALAVFASAYAWLSGPRTDCTACNIIVISLDSVRPDHMGLYGYERGTTPRIDAFASDAVVFDSFFSTAHLTPISEMSVQTGRYPFGNGVVSFHSKLRDDTTTLAEVLRQHGYRTAAFGSSPEYVVFPSIAESASRGFDTWSVFQPDSSGTSANRDTLPIDDILAWVRSDTKPFYLWVPVGAAHWPYDSGDFPNQFEHTSSLLARLPSGFKTYSQIYDGVWYPASVLPEHNDLTFSDAFSAYRNEETRLIREHDPGTTTPLTEDDWHELSAQYDEGIYKMDRVVGELLLALEDELDDTIVVIHSVHGEELGEWGYIGHYDIDESTIHNPLIIRVPGMRSRRVTALISGVDLFPTLMSLVQLPRTHRDGTDFSEYLRGVTTTEPRDMVFIERTPFFETLYTVEENPALAGLYDRLRTEDAVHHFHDSAVRTKEWKLIHRTGRKALARYSWWKQLTGEMAPLPEYELYHLTEDPKETRNVYDEYPDIAAPLRDRLTEWEAREAEHDPTPIDTSRQEYF